jgi:hypothetical protein
MADPSDPLRENDVGAFADLAARPNPDALVILAVPPIEDLIPALEQRLGRALTPEEVEAERRKAPSIAVARDAAERILAERTSRAQQGRPTVAGPAPGRLPPTVKGSYDEMPAGAADRKEAAVDLFGQHAFSARNQLLERLRRLVGSAEDRDRLGSLHRKEYDAVAALDPTGRDAALALARKAIDGYLQEILMLLTDTGDSLSFGPGHAINYRLILQVKDVGSNEAVEEFEINRGGRKVFYTDYARWLNRHDRHR